MMIMIMKAMKMMMLMIITPDKILTRRTITTRVTFYSKTMQVVTVTMIQQETANMPMKAVASVRRPRRLAIKMHLLLMMQKGK